MKATISLLSLLFVGATALAQTTSAPASQPASQPASAPVKSEPPATPALAPALNTPPQGEPGERTRSGAFTIVSTGALYGLLTGIHIDIQASVDSPEAAIGIPLLTSVAGGVLGHGYRKLHKKGFSDREASVVSEATLLGVGEAFVLSRAAGAELGAGDGIARGWIGATGGLLLGVGVVELLHPARGDAAMVGAGALWGSITAAELLAIAEGDLSNFTTTLAIGYNVGLALGVGAAIATDVSPYRIKIANGSAALGLIGGTLVGLLGALTLNTENPGSITAAGALLGQTAGFATGILLTRKK